MNTPEFYEKRLVQARASRQDVREAVWASNPEDYTRVEKETKSILRYFLEPRMHLLDAGCGIGELTDCLPEYVYYLGIDYCVGFIEVARNRYPGFMFEVYDLIDLTNLEYRKFDFAICRHVEGSCGDSWKTIVEQILSVSSKLLVIRAGDKPGDTFASLKVYE